MSRDLEIMPKMDQSDVWHLLLLLIVAVVVETKVMMRKMMLLPDFVWLILKCRWREKPILFSFLGFFVRIWLLPAQLWPHSFSFLRDVNPLSQRTPDNSIYVLQTKMSYHTHALACPHTLVRPHIRCPIPLELTSAKRLLASQARPLQCLHTQQGVTSSLRCTRSTCISLQANTSQSLLRAQALWCMSTATITLHFCVCL